jgi:prepilin-type processing-associated H-X9-DG protein
LTNASSYGLNGWLFQPYTPGLLPDSNQNAASWMNKNVGVGGFFTQQSNIRHPAGTMMYGDAFYDTGWPDSGDSATTYNLFQPLQTATLDAGQHILRFTIARHSTKNPAGAPTAFPQAQLLPGSINVALCDGHVENSKLDNLWSKYYWHTDGVGNPPQKRPGGP